MRMLVPWDARVTFAANRSFRLFAWAVCMGTTGSRRRKLDCQHMTSNVISLWDVVQDAESRGRYWQEQMRPTVDSSLSTQELADFLGRFMLF